MNRIIAITGATGFAGGHAVAELVKRGHAVRALVRTPAKAKLPEGVAVVQGDLGDAAALAALVEGADTVVHFAAALAARDRAGYFRVNEEGTRALVEAAEKARVRRFVHISSLAAREPQLSHYAASKRAGEQVVEQHMAALNAVIIRPPAVYGPGDRGTLPLIKELTRPLAVIPGRPEARFSLIHGRDLARIVAMAVEGNEQGIQEVSDGKAGGYGWEDLIASAAALRGANVTPMFLPRAIPAAVAFVVETRARLKGLTTMINRGKIAELYHGDWVAREGSLVLADPIPFAEGLAETVAWYRAAGWLPQALAPDRRAASSRTSQ